MEYTTGLTNDEFNELLVRLREMDVEGYLPVLGLSGSLQATLIHLRITLCRRRLESSWACHSPLFRGPSRP